MVVAGAGGVVLVGAAPGAGVCGADGVVVETGAVVAPGIVDGAVVEVGAGKPGMLPAGGRADPGSVVGAPGAGVTGAVVPGITGAGTGNVASGDGVEGVSPGAGVPGASGEPSEPVGATGTSSNNESVAFGAIIFPACSIGPKIQLPST